MTKKEEQALLIFERKIFRRIYGPKYENGEWKSRTNQELEEMNDGENIIKRIKGQRISWLGHLDRMEEDRMPKKIFTQELEGTRRRGRPRKRWKEEVERHLQVLGVRRWRELVTGRNGGIFFDRPKPKAGCSASGEEKKNAVQPGTNLQYFRMNLSLATTASLQVGRSGFHRISGKILSHYTASHAGRQ
jgi:hypothetical protein